MKPGRAADGSSTNSGSYPRTSMVPGDRWVEPTPFASKVTLSPASWQRRAAVRPDVPIPITRTSLIAVRLLRDRRVDCLEGDRHPKRHGRSNNRGEPDGADLRRGWVALPSSVPEGNRGVTYWPPSYR